MREDGRDVYPWSQPASYEAELGPSAGIAGWTTIATMEGHWSHLNLWFEGAIAYGGRAFRILGRIGGIWTILFQSTINAPPFALWDPGLGIFPGPTLTGIIAVVRGRPCDSFQVEVANSVAVPLPLARWRLHVWGRESDEASVAAAGGGPQPPIWTPKHSVGPVSVYTASLGPCLLNCAFCRNDANAVRWFQVHDTAAAPGAGAVPFQPGPRVAPNRSASQSYDAARMLVGVTLVSSLTAATYTVDAGASLDMGALIQ